MDYTEYAEITERLIDKYRDQMSDADRSRLDSAVAGGEHGYAAEDLVVALADLKIVVTPEEGNDLRRLWAATKGRTASENTIDGLTIAPDPP
ncbi:MAG: hypothetical protein ACRDT6_20830 [Micromonosporaceae bacterium]